MAGGTGPKFGSLLEPGDKRFYCLKGYVEGLGMRDQSIRGSFPPSPTSQCPRVAPRMIMLTS